jgi:hypothetical protein
MAPTLSARPEENRREFRAVLCKAAPDIGKDGQPDYGELLKFDPFGILYGRQN